MSKTFRPAAGRKRQRESGYALLMLVVMATILLIIVTAAAPSILTQGRREREEEMIWRGKQYVRGIKLFYRKTGHFPAQLDDLTKPKTGIRFMRQAYTDPMNKEDGSWRLLYVGAAGQLIGSLNPNANPSGISLGGSGANAGGVGANPGNAQNSPGTPGGTGSGENTNPQPITPSQPMGPIMGGNIIGVASKVNKVSVKRYEKATNYREWEFYWDPSKDGIGVGQPATGAQPGTPMGSPIGGPIGMPMGGPPLSNPPENNPSPIKP